MIVILNGTSSSGKTSILKSLQNSSESIYLEFGIDKFIFMLPKKYLNTSLWLEVMGAADKAGPVGIDLIKTMHKSAQYLNEQGVHLVLDHILIEDIWKQHIDEIFPKTNVFLFGIYCPLEILEERERTREDRTLGQAKKQFDIVHKNISYDEIIDTSKASPTESAQFILRYVATQQPKWKIVK